MKTEKVDDFLKMVRENKNQLLNGDIIAKLARILMNNGVEIGGNIVVYTDKGASPLKIKDDYAISMNLDFSEHDKQFKDKISELEEIINTKFGRWDKYGLSFSQILEMQEKVDKFDKGMVVSLPRNPINVAKMLIDKPDKYSVSDLRQIAQHLLIYCDNAPEDEE